MRELTKSMMSYTWAMSLFGVQQMVNLMRPGKATEAFNNVATAAAEELGETMKSTFRAGDNMQREMVDFTFKALMLGALDPNRWIKMGADVWRQSVGAAGRVARGCAPAGGQGPAGASQQGRQGQTQPGAGPGTGQQEPGWGPMPS